MNYYEKIPKKAVTNKKYKMNEKRKWYSIFELAPKNSLKLNWFGSDEIINLNEAKAQKANMQKAYPDKKFRIVVIEEKSNATVRFLE